MVEANPVDVHAWAKIRGDRRVLHEFGLERILLKNWLC